MNYIFINNTYLIPKVITFDKNELSLALQLLKKEGNNKNVYIVKTYKTLNLSIIFYKNNSFYRINNDTDINNFNHVNDVDFIQQFEKDKISLLDSDMVQLNEPVLNNTPNVNILESDTNIKAINENDSQTNNKNSIKNRLKEECESVIELYKIQKDKVNKLSKDVLIMEKKEKKLIQDIYDKKFNLLSILYTDLKVYEQLNEQDIPLLFCKKYEYFKNANKDDIEIYERIKSIDINKLLDEGINEETVNKYKLNELFITSNKYSNDLKKLNVVFEHSWNELEDDLGE